MSRLFKGLIATGLAAVACAAVIAAGESERELPVIKAGDNLTAAPEFRLADVHGVRWKLSETKAPVVLIHVWSKYRDCESDLKLLQKLHEKYGDRGVIILGLVYSSGTRDEIAEYLDALGVTFPTLMCTEGVLQAYDVATFPTTFLLDGNRRIRYWMYGILVEDHWDRIIDELLTESEESAV